MYALVTNGVHKAESKKVAFENIIKTFNLPPGSIRYGYNETTGEGCWDSIIVDNMRIPKKGLRTDVDAMLDFFTRTIIAVGVGLLEEHFKSPKTCRKVLEIRCSKIKKNMKPGDYFSIGLKFEHKKGDTYDFYAAAFNSNGGILESEITAVIAHPAPSKKTTSSSAFH